MTDKKPLWLLMDNASWDRMKQGPYAPQDIRAAELRALAHEVAPEEPEPVFDDDRWGYWLRGREIRQRLLDAAAEAEGKG